MSALRLAIFGCTGKMGRAVVRLASADDGFRVVAAVTRAGDPYLAQDAGSPAGAPLLGVAVAQECAASCDVAIEFTSPSGCVACAEWAAARGVAVVSGATGLAPPQQARVEAAARAVPIVRSPNMSVGVNVLLKLVADAARQLGPEWDVEIVEAHHRQKTDAPSGTARALLQAVCDVRSVRAEEVVKPGRSGECGPRRAGEIGVHAVRMGGVVGEHDVHFADSGEVLTLGHRAASRDIFAAGALRAARWVVGRQPGLYSMRDVLSG
ncbi:MAG: 4-hydroxy-tetrahydrodipicolinate reductase [Phycisphaerae bacterium]|jgi:4-hydroxy-tetrahydrodipicolinate reductase